MLKGMPRKPLELNLESNATAANVKKGIKER